MANLITTVLILVFVRWKVVVKITLKGGQLLRGKESGLPIHMFLVIVIVRDLVNHPVHGYSFTDIQRHQYPCHARYLVIVEIVFVQEFVRMEWSVTAFIYRHIWTTMNGDVNNQFSKISTLSWWF